jgi:hypothetical protein
VWGTEIGFEMALKALTILNLTLLMLHRNRDFYINPYINNSGAFFLLFGLYAIIITFISNSANNYPVNNNINFMLSFIFSVLIIQFLLSGKLVLTDVFRIYSDFVWIIIFICIIQWGLLIGGLRVSFKLPGLTYADSWAQLSSQVFGMNEYPTSLFSEKAHFCEFLVPYLACCLFSDSLIQNRRLLKAIVVTLLIVMSVSGNGVVLAFLCWGLYFTLFNQYKSINKVLLIVLGIGVIFASFYILTRIDTVNSMLSMLFTNNKYGYSKANYRVYRGFDMFGKLPITQKIFGVGYYRMQAFAEQYNIVSNYDTSWNTYEYFSGFTQVLLYFGIIGFILTLLHIMQLFKVKYNITRGLIILFIAVSLSSEILFQGFHIVYILLILSTIHVEDIMYTNDFYFDPA